MSASSCQCGSFDWRVDLIFLFGWIENEVPLHSFLKNFEPKSDEIFDGHFCCHVMIE
jgi:hypothetical protein